MRRRQPEQQIQRAIVQHCRARLTPGVFWFAVPNGGFRSAREAAIMSGTGTRPGVPDLCFIHAGRSYFLELKSEAGKLTPRQTECIEALNLAGAVTAVANGVDAAIKCLEDWKLLRGQAT